jgi:hypothetical protein
MQTAGYGKGPNMKRGLYRIHGVDGQPDDVRVDDDGIEVPVEERLYRNRGHMPVVADLPWQEDYLKKSPENLPSRLPPRTSVGGGINWDDTARGRARRPSG